MNLGAGDDQLLVQKGSIANQLTILMGDGKDKTTLSKLMIGRYLHYEGNNGEDSLLAQNVTVTDPTFAFFSSIDTQDGADSVTLKNFQDRDLEITLGDERTTSTSPSRTSSAVPSSACGSTPATTGTWSTSRRSRPGRCSSRWDPAWETSCRRTGARRTRPRSTTRVDRTGSCTRRRTTSGASRSTRTSRSAGRPRAFEGAATAAPSSLRGLFRRRQRRLEPRVALGGPERLRVVVLLERRHADSGKRPPSRPSTACRCERRA